MQSSWKCITLLFLSGFSLISTAQTSCNVSEFREDLDTLKFWVEDIHPWPFSRCSQADWDSAYTVSSLKLDSISSNFEFALICGQFLSVLEDSHTLLGLADVQNEADSINGEFHLRLKYLDGGFYVFKDQHNGIKLGTRIESINGISVEDHFNDALAISTQEGNSYTSKVRLAELLINPVVLNGLKQGSESVEVVDAEGNKYDYPLFEIAKRKKVKSVVEWVWPEEGINSNTASLKVKSFIDGKDSRYLKDLKKGFKKLSKNPQITHLVIDLRNNLGGSAMRMEMLLNYLTTEEMMIPEAVIMKQCKESKEKMNDVYKGVVKWVVDKFEDKVEEFKEFKKIALLEVGESDTLQFELKNYEFKHVFEGEVCLLQNGLSASASVSFASEFLSLDRGVIIGESCMGPTTGTFANPVLRRLPNSDLAVSVATGVFAMDSTFNWHSSPIKPNRWIQWTPDDMSANLDPHLSAVEDWVKYPETFNDFEFQTREAQVLFTELETVYSAERGWGGEVRQDVFERIIDCDECVGVLEKQIDEIEKSSENEGTILEKIIYYNGLKRDCVEYRNSSILLKLPVELRGTFMKLVAPNRPAVLHFGIHNRADCKVCI